MSVRCKVAVVEKSERWDSYSGKQNSTEVRLVPVTGDENKTWSKWTPSGEIKLSITNPEALKAFELGKTYFVDFASAPATEAEETK